MARGRMRNMKHQIPYVSLGKSVGVGLSFDDAANRARQPGQPKQQQDATGRAGNPRHQVSDTRM